MKKSLKALLSFVTVLAVVCTLFAVPASAASTDPSFVPYVFMPNHSIMNNVIFVEPGTTFQQLGLSYANNTGVNFEQTGTPGERFIQMNSTDKLRTGCWLYVYHFFKTSIIGRDDYYIAVKGDINCDGKVDIEDIKGVNDHILGKQRLNYEKLVAGDVNLDEVVDIYDLLAIQTYVITGEWNL